MRRFLLLLSYIGAVGVYAHPTVAQDERPTIPPEKYLHPSGFEQLPHIDNLRHPDDYEVGTLGTLGNVIRIGHGPTAMVMVTGFGLSAENFIGFMEDNADRYTMFAVTAPGYAGTSAPPIPPSGSSSGDRVWSRAFEQAVIDLIEQERLSDVVLVGHFSGGAQHVMKIAAARPDLIGRVVVLAGEIVRGPPSGDRASRNDALAERWFKTVTPRRWLQGSYHPEVFSRDDAIAWGVWRQAGADPIPNQLQYLLEFRATDVRDDLEDFSIPTLVLLPQFDETVPEYAPAFFVDSWQEFRERTDVFTFETVEGAHAMLWLDNPQATYAAIAAFVGAPE